jgi:hypothetical protein
VPQGATISPLLANVYLHYVFDLWAHRWRGRHARGDVILVRFADDLAVGFEHRDDAERFQVELGERFARFGIELAADKTRLVEAGAQCVEAHAGICAGGRRQRRSLPRPKAGWVFDAVHDRSRLEQWHRARVNAAPSRRVESVLRLATSATAACVGGATTSLVAVSSPTDSADPHSQSGRHSWDRAVSGPLRVVGPLRGARRAMSPRRCAGPDAHTTSPATHRRAS